MSPLTTQECAHGHALSPLRLPSAQSTQRSGLTAVSGVFSLGVHWTRPRQSMTFLQSTVSKCK